MFADDEQSELERDLENFMDNPQDFDCGFEEQRCGTGFANFGFDPVKAHEMREKELARIAAELEDEPAEYEDDENDDLFSEWEEIDRHIPKHNDRFADSYGFDDEVDNS